MVLAAFILFYFVIDVQIALLAYKTQSIYS